MQYQGIIPGRPFPVDRPLTEQDHKYRLRQDERQEDVTPYPDLVVVKLNSTHLEVVDKYYGWKGLATFMFNALALMPIFFVVWAFFLSIEKFHEGKMEGVYFGAFSISIMLTISGVAWYLGRFDWAYYTHYPIRLNRKTQKVYVFRKNGSVLIVPWKDLFFTLDQDARIWEIRGHVLGDDGKTVKETFALGTNDVNSPEGMRKLRSHWEFFRRYMAEGPDAVARYVKWAAPVDGKRESFRVGYEVLASNFRHPNPLVAIMGIIVWPIIALSSLARWVAMRTSKIPQWPAQVEAENVVAADDPVRIDARINPPELR